VSHYFIENTDLLTHERILPLMIFNEHFRFLSNNGLFSCDRVDGASILLLEHIPGLLAGERLLDLGCGYGVLGIVLARKYGVDLTFSDVNGVALAYATRNAALNDVAAKAVHSDGFDGISDMFRYITLNPPIHAGKDVMYRLYEGAAMHLLPEGTFYVIIQKKHGAESSMKKLLEIFSAVDVLYKRRGYFVLACRHL